MTTPSHGGGEENEKRKGSRWASLVVIGCVVVLIVAVLVPRQTLRGREGKEVFLNVIQTQRAGGGEAAQRLKPAATAEEIVASKVDQFARDRLRIARAMAKRLDLKLPNEVEQFFNAAAAGRWQELNELYQALQRLRDNPEGEKLRSVWGPIMETLLIAECAHSWPAQKLLDYGQATLGSLGPGMVYIGGTDPGRGIPTLLNETSEGDRHIVITQNGLADATYLDYVKFLYGDQMTTLTQEDTKRAFDKYIADAQKRLEHDRQFPDEPKQVRAGEDIQWLDSSDGGNGTNVHVKVSGAVAVMGINERLLQAIMDKNPGLSFALEESFPLVSTYSSAVPLGPIMELRAPDAQASFTPEKVQQTVDYWNATAQQLIGDSEAPEGSDVRKAYSKLADAQANLLASHDYDAQAEQTYRLAMQMEPSSPEAVYSLANLLVKTGRPDEAQQLIDTFRRNHPVQETVPAPTLIVPAPGPK